MGGMGWACCCASCPPAGGGSLIERFSMDRCSGKLWKETKSRPVHDHKQREFREAQEVFGDTVIDVMELTFVCASSRTTYPS